MKMTVKENINVNSIVLKHKIALETITLLEGRENLLYTDMMIYTMVSFVDNCIEENLINLINEDESEDFAIIVENVIEPEFNKLIEDKSMEILYYEILDYVNEYMTNMDYKKNTAIGLLNFIIDSIGEIQWEDLKFFFQDLSRKAIDTIPDKKEEVKKVTPQQFEGATEQIKELIQKYQREGEEIKKQREGSAE
jgi:hypothetical protein